MNEVERSKIQELNRLHGEILGAMRTTLHKAVEAGGILREVKDTLPHGQFTRWVEDNIDFDIRTAQRYMKAHDNRDRIKNDSLSYLKELVEEPRATPGDRPTPSPLQNLFGNDKIRVSEMGVEIIEDLTFLEWGELLERSSFLNTEKDATRWILGDLLNYGMKKHVEACHWIALCAEEAGWTPQEFIDKWPDAVEEWHKLCEGIIEKINTEQEKS